MDSYSSSGFANVYLEKPEAKFFTGCRSGCWEMNQRQLMIQSRILKFFLGRRCLIHLRISFAERSHGTTTKILWNLRVHRYPPICLAAGLTLWNQYLRTMFTVLVYFASVCAMQMSMCESICGRCINISDMKTVWPMHLIWVCVSPVRKMADNSAHTRTLARGTLYLFGNTCI